MQRSLSCGVSETGVSIESVGSPRSAEHLQEYLDSYKTIGKKQLAQYMDPENGLLLSLMDKNVLFSSDYQ